MPRISDERRAAQRDRVLQAAIACFARRGTHATTMDDICREAKLSRGAVYGYFESKAALVRAIFEAMEQNTRVALEQTASADSPAETLFAFATRALEQIAHPANRAMLQLDQELKAEAARDPEIRELGARNYAFALPLTRRVVQAMQRQGAIPEDLDATTVARVLIAVQDGLKPQLLVDPDFNLRRFLKTVRALLLRTAPAHR
jgi:AcrR family transcriptional regulator